MGVDTPFVGVCGLCLDSSVCVCVVASKNGLNCLIKRSCAEALSGLVPFSSGDRGSKATTTKKGGQHRKRDSP